MSSWQKVLLKGYFLARQKISLLCFIEVGRYVTNLDCHDCLLESATLMLLALLSFQGHCATDDSPSRL